MVTYMSIGQKVVNCPAILSVIDIWISGIIIYTSKPIYQRNIIRKFQGMRHQLNSSINVYNFEDYVGIIWKIRGRVGLCDRRPGIL